MKLIIRDSDEKRQGPGNNIFSKNNVKIKTINEYNDCIEMQIDGSCAEVYYQQIPYGVYELKLLKPIFLPKGIIFAVFLYEDDKHEYDIESEDGAEPHQILQEHSFGNYIGQEEDD